MKSFFTCLVLSAAMAVTAAAQPGFSKSDMPAAGETYYYTNIKGNLSGYEQTGTNYSWNFSSITDLSQDSINLLKPSKINPAFSVVFFGAAGLKEPSPLPAIQDYYSFMRATDAAYTKAGTAFTVPIINQPLTMVYTSPETIYKFPVAYGNKDSGRFEGQAKMLQFSYSSKGFRRTYVDGWGELKTPHGTFTTLRLHVKVSQTDSFGPTGISYDREEYIWLAQGYKMPVLEIVVPAKGSMAQARTRYLDSKKNIQNPNAPKISFTAADTALKTGEVLALQNNTTGALQYEWSVSPAGSRFADGTNASTKAPKIVFDKAGLYSITLTATGLTGKSTFTRYNWIIVEQGEKPVAAFRANEVKAAENAVIRFTDESSNNPQRWEWTISPMTGVSFEAGTTFGSQNPQVKFTKEGLYTVKLTAANASGAGSVTKVNFIEIVKGNGVPKVAAPAISGLYPNPATDIAILYLEGKGSIQVSIYDAAGAERLSLKATAAPNGTIALPISNLKPGIYVVKATHAGGSMTQRLIKQ